MKAMLPITTGVIPFGLVMGTISATAKLSLFQTMTMNIFVFAGAAQLAAVELLSNKVPLIIVVLTAVTINLRFLLYSAALSPVFKNESSFKKLLLSYTITDQSYASLIANANDIERSQDKIVFYVGTCLVMIIAWQSSVFTGFIFGNILPIELSLDYAVPLSFIALVMPTLKNKRYIYVALASALCSVLLRDIPFNLGLLISAMIAICFAIFLNSRDKL